MTYAEFKQLYSYLKKQTPSLRMGQLFIYRFVKDDTKDDIFMGLWEQTDDAKAEAQIIEIMYKYQWDFNELPDLRHMYSKGGRYNEC